MIVFEKKRKGVWNFVNNKKIGTGLTEKNAAFIKFLTTPRKK